MKSGLYFIIFVCVIFLIISMFGIESEEMIAKGKKRKIDPYAILAIIYVILILSFGFDILGWGIFYLD